MDTELMEMLNETLDDYNSGNDRIREIAIERMREYLRRYGRGNNNDAVCVRVQAHAMGISQ